ncbi:MAG: hypothetical protein A2Y81_11855, partial [Nitrospirae bacterium RBG_13_43_8]
QERSFKNNKKMLTPALDKTVEYPHLTAAEEWGFSMKGIRPEGRCPFCKGTFKAHSKLGYVCQMHQTVPLRYSIDFYFKGERIRRCTTLDGKTLRTFADAHALIRQAQGEIEAKKFDPTKWKSKDRLEFKFKHLIGKWYGEKEDLLKKKRLAPSYVTKLFSYIKHYYLDYFDEKDVREIFNIRDFARELPGNLSLHYQSNIVKALENFFHWLRDERIIQELPVFPKMEIPEHLPKTIDRATREKLLDFIPGEHKAIFTFLFYQGCRPSEARALKWDSVEEDVVTYKRTWSGEELRETTKENKVRQNLIFSEVLAALPRRSFSLDFVFTHGKNVKRHYSKTFLHDIFNRALQAFNEHHQTDLKINLYEATKHSFGTEQVNQGVSIEL